MKKSPIPSDYTIELHAMRIAHAEAMAATALGNYNEALEAGRHGAADKWLAKSQRWLDRANKLRGWA